MKKLIGIAVLAILILSVGCGMPKYYQEGSIKFFVDFAVHGVFSQYSQMEEQEIYEHIQLIGQKSDEFLLTLLDSGSTIPNDPKMLGKYAWITILRSCLDFEQDNGFGSSFENPGIFGVFTRELEIKSINRVVELGYLRYTPAEKIFEEESELDEILRMFIPYDRSNFPVWEDESFREKWDIYTSNEYYDETKKKSGELAEKLLSEKVLNYNGSEKMNKDEEIEFFHALIFRWQYEFDKFNESFVPFDSNGLINKWQDFLINEFRDRENTIEIRDIESLKASVDLVYGLDVQRDTIRIDEK